MLPSRGAEPPGSLRLADRIALVTGSTEGIGSAIARRLASDGASVIISGRNEIAGTAVAEEITSSNTVGEATFVDADMRSSDAIEDLVSETVATYGGLDILVNTATTRVGTTARETTLEDWESLLETNFRAYWLTTKYAVEYLAEGGRVVNVSSNHAFMTEPGRFPYNVVTSGIDGLTRALAVELGPIGIRVNSINPGWIETERTRETLEERSYEAIESIHPLGRVGQPGDVATAVAFLASEESAFVTGISLPVDGGRSVVLDDTAVCEYACNDTNDSS